MKDSNTLRTVTSEKMVHIITIQSIDNFVQF